MGDLGFAKWRWMPGFDRVPEVYWKIAGYVVSIYRGSGGLYYGDVFGGNGAIWERSEGLEWGEVLEWAVGIRDRVRDEHIG